jgi:hypothetical protein
MAGGPRRQREAGYGKIGDGQNEHLPDIGEGAAGFGPLSTYDYVHFVPPALLKNQEITNDCYGAILGFAVGLDKSRERGVREL